MAFQLWNWRKKTVNKFNRRSLHKYLFWKLFWFQTVLLLLYCSIIQIQRFLIVIVSVAILLAALVPAASASNTCGATSSNKSCSACSDARDLKKSIALALDETDGVSLTDEGRSLRATIEGVLSKEECRFLVEKLPPHAFKDAGGYESTSNKYNANRNGYSGVGLEELAKS